MSKLLLSLLLTSTLLACGGGDPEPRSWLDQLNSVRATGACGNPPAGPVSVHPALTASSQGHAQYIASTGVPAHTGQAGSSSPDRAWAAGYRAPAGENVAAGMSTFDEALAGWITSKAHCDNMMSQRLVHVGLGHAEGKPYGHYWVLGVGE